MDTSRLEELLEQLVEKQDELISRLETLESTVQAQLGEVHTELISANHSLSSVHDQLNWWGENPSLAKQVLDALGEITNAVDSAA